MTDKLKCTTPQDGCFEELCDWCNFADHTGFDSEIFMVIRKNVGRSKAHILSEIKTAVPNKTISEISDALDRLSR